MAWNNQCKPTIVKEMWLHYWLLAWCIITQTLISTLKVKIKTPLQNKNTAASDYTLQNAFCCKIKQCIKLYFTHGVHDLFFKWRIDLLGLCSIFRWHNCIYILLMITIVVFMLILRYYTIICVFYYKVCNFSKINI